MPATQTLTFPEENLVGWERAMYAGLRRCQTDSHARLRPCRPRLGSINISSAHQATRDETASHVGSLATPVLQRNRHGRY